MLCGINGTLMTFDNYSDCNSESVAVKLNYKWKGRIYIYIGGK